jgi:Lon protease-like protein
MNEDKASLENFSGIARLFPLPNLVFCPHALQPLHIFEPRFRQMTADALDDDRLIALVLLQPGWENHYDQLPPLHSIACLGRVVFDQLLPDGRYNLLLRGVSRVRIVEEIPTEKLYRSARVELVPDQCHAPLALLTELRRKLADKILPRFNEGLIAKQLADLFHSELSLGALCDVLSFALPIPIEWKQMMLEEPSDSLRANLLLQGFDMVATPPLGIIGNPHRKFPLQFSRN